MLSWALRFTSLSPFSLPIFPVEMLLHQHICKHVDFLEKASLLLAHLEQVISNHTDKLV